MSIKDKKVGEVFISKLTGKKVITKLGEKGRCVNCVFKDNKHLSCIGFVYNIRQREAGHCSKESRKDGNIVYFEEVEKLYEISKETMDLILELDKTTLTSDERLNAQMTLLNAEYLSYHERQKTRADILL